MSRSRRRSTPLLSRLLLGGALALGLSCASVDDEGRSPVADSAAAATGKNQAGSPTAAPATGQAAVVEAKRARPASLGVDTSRWLSAADKKLVLGPKQLTTIYDNVVYQPDAVVFDAGSVDAYQKHDDASGQFRFDAAKLEAGKLKLETGKVFMIPGLALRRVKSVKTEGGSVVVDTESAALTDVIKDGTIGFQARLSLEPQHVIGWLHEGVKVNPQPVPSSTGTAGVMAMPLPSRTSSGMRLPEFSLAAPAPGEFNPQVMTWTFKKAGISYELKLDVQGEQAKFLVKATKESPKGREAQYWAKGTFKQVYLNAKGEYKDGEVKSLEYQQPDMVGDFEISISAAGKGQGISEINFPLPEAMLKYVIPVGSIPFVVEIKAQMIGRISVPTKASATATAKFKWSGQAGIEYKGSDIKAEAGFAKIDIKPDPFDSAAMIGNAVDAQWGVGVPRVSASAFGTFFVPFIQPGITVGSKLQWGPLCKSGYVRFTVIAGWDFGVLGVNLANSKKKLFEKEQRAPKGGCK